MSILAVVHCTCWREGGAAPPPVAPHRVGVDEGGGIVWLDQPEDMWLDPSVTDEQREISAAFAAWTKRGCRHLDMILRDDNVTDLGFLEEVSARLSPEDVAVLRAVRPRGVGGHLPFERCVEARDPVARLAGQVASLPPTASTTREAQVVSQLAFALDGFVRALDAAIATRGPIMWV